MSAGSAASNLGFGHITPFSNSNGNFVNKFSENNPAFFSSNEIPGTQGLPGLGGAKLNTDAAAGIVPGLCSFKGGAKHFKRKIKNITKRYKDMGKSKKTNKKRIKTLKSKISSLSLQISGGRKKRSYKKQRGGYHAQYQNNQPFNITYSLGGILSPSESALANPAPIYKVTNQAIDNLNAYTMKGFPSRGH